MNSEKGMICEAHITEFQAESKVKYIFGGVSEQGIFGKAVLETESKEVPGRFFHQLLEEPCTPRERLKWRKQRQGPSEPSATASACGPSTQKVASTKILKLAWAT